MDFNKISWHCSLWDKEQIIRSGDPSLTKEGQLLGGGLRFLRAFLAQTFSKLHIKNKSAVLKWNMTHHIVTSSLK